MRNPFFHSCVQLPDTKPGLLLYVGVPRVDTGLQLARRQPDQPMPALRTGALAIGTITSVYQIDDPQHELYSFAASEQTKNGYAVTVEMVQGFSEADLMLLQTALRVWELPYLIGKTERKDRNHGLVRLLVPQVQPALYHDIFTQTEPWIAAAHWAGCAMSALRLAYQN